MLAFLKRAGNPGSSSSESWCKSTQWLDLLPERVCEQIASYVRGGDVSEELCDLAHVSPKQRHAVLSAIDFTLDDISSPFWPTSKWFAIVKGQIREVSFVTYEKEARSLYTSSSLRRVTHSYYAHHGDIRILGLAKNLEYLKTELFGIEEFNTMLKTLPKLVRLTELDLKVGLISSEVEDPSALATSCPTLRKLSFRAHLMDIETSWSVINAFQNLTELTINHPVPRHAIAKLKRIPSVRISTIKKFLKLAKRVGRNITAIESRSNEYDWYAGLSDVEALSICPQLSELKLCVLSDAWPGIVSISNNLRVLEIIGKDFGTREHISEYACVPLGSVVDVAKAARNLEVFRVFCFKLSRAEIAGVFEIIAPTLRAFAISLECQDEPQLERLTWIMELAQKARKLETFEVEDEQVMEVRGIDYEERKYDIEHHAESDIMAAELAAERLFRAAPRLNKNPLLQRIEDMRDCWRSSDETSSATDDFECHSGANTSNEPQD